MRVAAEARTFAVGSAAEEAQSIRGNDGLMVPVPEADQLQPSGTGRELIITADVAGVTVELLNVGARARFAVGLDPIIAEVDGVPIGRVTENQVADGRPGSV